MAPDPLVFNDDYLRVRAVPTCHTSTFVWCHSKGQRGGDWKFMVEPLRKLGHCNHIAFIFPYLDYNETNCGNDISSNEALIQKIVHQEIANGCDPGRIAVGGYNEGLEVALRATLADSYKIGSILGITDCLNMTDEVNVLRKTANAKTPVLFVDRMGAKNNGPEKLLKAIEQPVRVVNGTKLASSDTQPVTQVVR
ncbi:hypothetical protein N7474_010954 [Penicillium riverlandense]|uniref:uncharacterized protein n=1 Tax=Penicillium riverlandense TaxID=1903569 RepID=UPI00254943C2|nr:uncharacterized protein N7474_010954 [Penicillium riverlandense]KAJ5805067.1 hypothetical protein N7474_010954 [Penicillium riverlandense]